MYHFVIIDRHNLQNQVGGQYTEQKSSNTLSRQVNYLGKELIVYTQKVNFAT